MIAPWLGEAGTGAAAIPTPALIDITLRGAVTDARLADLRDTVLAIFHRHGFAQATEIGRLEAGSDVSIVA